MWNAVLGLCRQMKGATPCYGSAIVIQHSYFHRTQQKNEPDVENSSLVFSGGQMHCDLSSLHWHTMIETKLYPFPLCYSHHWCVLHSSSYAVVLHILSLIRILTTNCFRAVCTCVCVLDDFIHTRFCSLVSN